MGQCDVPETQDDLPAGIVTFAFTDIEGSTRLLRRLGEQYPAALERHRTILREAWQAHDGFEVATAGDSFFVAFSDARDAAAACAQAQRAIGNEAWPAGAEVKVRMGVHTGLASPRGRDYVALAVHQAARVMAAAHGGQVLLSAETVQRLGDLAADVEPVGRFRVRDFDDDVQLFRMCGPGLCANAPPRALPAEGHNLVKPPTSFVGRDDALAGVIDHVAPGRVVTLTGPGGTGKTRLAIEVGLQIAPRWPDGVWLVDLAPYQDGAHVVTAIAAAVGAPRSGDDAWADVIGHLRSRKAVVLLDSCEHLVTACAEAVQRILQASPGCAVLATSRGSLGAPGELVRRVEPLAGAAEQLLIDRARLVRPELVVDERNLAIIEEICRQLDGLPLALELAAARFAVLSPAEVLDGLRDRFRLLRSRGADVPERQRTLTAMLEWSDRLLRDDERTCLRRLALFPGGFTTAAAAAAVADGAIDEVDVDELVWSLVDKSLVVADLRANGTRYRLLESVRAYALEHLVAAGDRDAVAARLARWYLDRIGPRHRHAPGWSSETGVELDNLRTLIPIVSTAEPARSQELAFTIGRHLDAVHAYRDGIDELRGYVTTLTTASPARVSMMTTLADLELRIGDVDAAERTIEAAEAVAASSGALPEWDDVAILRTRGEIASRRGDHSAAIESARLALASALSPRGRARMWSQLGIASLAVGDVETAWQAFGEERNAYIAIGDEIYRSSAEGNLAEVALRRGDIAGAAEHQRACLELSLELGAPTMAAFSLIVAARIAAHDRAWPTAVSLHAAAESVLQRTGFVLYEDDRRISDEMLDEARRTLGGHQYDAASAAGSGLDLPAAAAIAGSVLADAIRRDDSSR